MPWEDPINGSNLTHDERVEMIALIDNILANLDENGEIDRMNSLEITAYKAFVAHRKAFDTWENGNIDKVWLDDNKNICIKYTSGKWWHYSVSKSGEWMWW